MFDKERGLAHGPFVSGFAVGLKGFELGGVLFQRAVDAAFVDGEKLQVVRLLNPSLGLSQGGIDLRMTGVHFVEVLTEALGEDAVFEGAGALQAPHIFGDGLGEIGLSGPGGVVLTADRVAVRAEDFGLFGRRDVNLAAQAVTVRI